MNAHERKYGVYYLRNAAILSPVTIGELWQFTSFHRGALALPKSWNTFKDTASSASIGQAGALPLSDLVHVDALPVAR